ncbi:hypothetical protein PSN45_003703 [Yamadazyma tenuis]|uniref:Zn(2)-C6 fungal-type domain-containing protein n=1 Tax=Candida tenuis (strain ATCC 10573 / BCRC 21748 / CBS 615 / JCM 9827 / NBRC 10315 / NRRL Y-1498 / VKM Y-70) TaxID=590646 RepID=G3B3K5_CANTC|nr:uncharacterized protein CANTEDRAFT_93693 [Yamadazyma tenuis ATCC 10573]EGV64176.1 hypothetical protein CANTEDRAFT_93693 [Yamadazyma tenuis ATCC 10573]WEJ96167.1 hypothetical protein PSN45_003703 [Yamadazyma tenuis]
MSGNSAPPQMQMDQFPNSDQQPAAAQPTSAPGRSASPEQKDKEEQPKKKRRATVRACDACAIRKVKCEVQRPCHHCVANGLKCTQIRTRKKSGPKNLHRKTLDYINSLSTKETPPVPETASNNYPESALIASNHRHHPIEPLPMALTSSVPVPVDPHSSRFTTDDLVTVIRLVNEPVFNAVLQEVTIRSLLSNNDKLITFIDENMKNMLSLDSILNSSDPVFLSKALALLSFCLVVIENAIELLVAKFSYSFLNTMEYYRDLKRTILFKIMESFSIIDKLLLYPLKPTNLFQIFYNQSIGSINLSSYFNLTRDHDPLYSSQQKVLHLRKAITYYQLINHHQIGASNSKSLNTFQINELFERLFLSERYNYLTATHLINSTNLFDLNLSLSSNNALFNMFKVINSDGLIFHRLKSHNVLMNLHQLYKINHYPDSNNLLTKNYLNLKMSLINLSKNDFFYSILNQVLIFKVLMIYSNNLELNVLELELIEVVKNLNSILSYNDVLHLNFCNFNLLPQLLQILKINIDFENNLNYSTELIVFTKKLTPFFSTVRDIEHFVKSNKIIYDWFEEMDHLTANMNEIFNPQSRFSSLPVTETTSYSSPIPRSTSDPPAFNPQQQSGPFVNVNALPTSYQLHHHLNKLQQSQVNLQQINSRSSTDSRDKSELNDLLQDFGNSKLSSNSSTNNNSAMVTNCPTPDMDGQPSPLSQQAIQNSNSTSYSTIIQNLGLPAPPIITTANINRENEASNLSPSNISESTKNLCNLFTQMNDGIPSSQNNSLTNLLQFTNSSNNVANLNKISSLSNFRSSNSLKLINSNSALNLFINPLANDEDDEKRKNLKDRFLL